MFTKRIDLGKSGGAKNKKLPKPKLMKSDAAYFMLTTFNIDLDQMEKQALLTNLPPNIQLDGEMIPHPYIDWSPGSRATTFVDFDGLQRAISLANDIVTIVPKQVASEVISQLISEYRDVEAWQTADIVLVWAKKSLGFLSKKNQHQIFDIEDENWEEFIDNTSEWDSEKIIEDGYMQHLGCNYSSPYLTHLETD